MTRRQGYSLRVYLRLLRRDVRCGLRRLVVVRRRRGQLIIVFSRPSHKTSRNYGRKWRQSRRQNQPHRGIALGSVLVVLGAIGVTVALMQLNTIWVAKPVAPVAAVAVKPVASTPAVRSLPRSLPVRFAAPDVGIDTSLIELGRNDDGTLETPAGYDVAGWYKYSPTPGEIGPAVLTGHVDNYHGPAVFFRLKNLQPGQKMTVTRVDGSVATFTVTRLEQFDQNNFPTAAVYGNTKDSELRVITCGGPFDHLHGKYTQNVVVFATLD